MRSVFEHHGMDIHWLHDHSEEAPQFLSLFANPEHEDMVDMLLLGLLEDVKTCSTCVVAYHAAQVSPDSLVWHLGP